MEAFTLKPFQQKAVSVIAPQIGKKDNILISMPQGSGRIITLVAALQEYYKSGSGRTLFIADSERLKEQLKSVAKQFLGYENVVSASSVPLSEGKLIYVETLPWLLEHTNEIASDAFAVIVYVYYDYLGFGQSEGGVRRLWEYFKPLTNIGIGYDARGVRSFFKDITFQYSLEDAINDSVLRSLEIETIKITKKESDYYKLRNGKNILEYQGAIQTVSEYLVEYLSDKKTIVFVGSQQNALELSEAVNSRSGGKELSFPLISTVDVVARQKVINRFREDSGIRMLIGVDLLLRETALTDIDCIVLLRRFRNVDFFLEVISGFLRMGKKTTPVRIKDFVGMDFSTGIFPDGLLVLQEPESSEEPVKEIRFSRTPISYADRNKLEGVLGVKEIAGELADIILGMPCEQGRMIGIFGKWGRGKTFLMNKTWDVIKSRSQNVVRIDFQAWKYQDTPAIWAYLYEKFASAYYCSAENAWNRLLWRLKLNYKRLGYWNLLWFIVTFVSSFILSFLIPFETKINWIYQILTSLGVSAFVSIILIFFSYRNSARELFCKYYSKVSFSRLLGIQAEIQKELKTLIKVWTGKNTDFKILLFVDDIDRCSEEKMVQIIDSLRVMLDDQELAERIVIVAAIDEKILKMAIQCKYAALGDIGKEKEVVSEYIDKLFLIGLKLGNLTSEEVDEFFRAFTEQDREEGELPLLEQLLSPVSEDEHNEPEKEDFSVGKKEKNGFFPENDTENDMDPKEEFQQGFEDEELEEREQQVQSLNSKLSLEEINILRKILQTFPHKTPRQIRVFYYRYVIAKHLLIKISPDNIWTKSSYIESFIRLLLILSDSPDHAEIIVQEKETVTRETGRFYKVALLDGIEVAKMDYKILLKVLDLVIGY